MKVINKDGQEEWRKLEFLSSQMKQELHSRILDSIKSLSILKKKGFKVGRIKYTKNINSIPLKQFKIIWAIQNNRIKIQGLKKTLPINGLDQILAGSDFENAVLLKKASGYYIAVTSYQEKKIRVLTGKSVGLDFGIKNNLTTSDGEIFNISIPETPKLKRLQRIYSKKRPKSKQARKVNLQVRKEYEKIGNRKHDKVNKIVSHLVKSYDKIYIQDKMIKSWHQGLFGKQIQKSATGAIKSRLKNLESVSIISRTYPSTKQCYICGKINSIPLDQRIYKCECGLSKDRDIKSAKTILRDLNPCAERTCTLLKDSISIFEASNSFGNKLNPLKEEDHSL